ncbi:MAG: hypothetical protein AYL29_015710 [Candidatus Bathyarchaeota archaeon B24]|nr:MAG: hypothetical protein AYL29_015710 [Candidatus Bathyarchaeota archaeon B24]RLI24418.1 MAG: nucleoside hydrolase [Candidatus Bathyarchaeota archaeon]
MFAVMVDIILDTDIGDDIDDALALLFALKSPELRVKAVTTVYGDVETRAMLALRIIEAMEIRDLPVQPGASKPLLEARPSHRPNQAVVLEGWKPKLPVRWKRDAGNAVKLIAEMVEESRGDVTIVSVGPLTNIALALATYPWIAEEARLVMMAGCYSWQEAEYNASRDPEATRIVFESGIPLTMVGIDVTLKCRMNRDQVEAFKMSELPEVKLVYRMMEAWMEATGRRHFPILHDPLAVAVSFDRDLVKTMPMRIRVEVRGEYTRGFTVPTEGEPNADVCVDVDKDRFMDLFMRRVLG